MPARRTARLEVSRSSVWQLAARGPAAPAIPKVAGAFSFRPPLLYVSAPSWHLAGGQVRIRFFGLPTPGGEHTRGLKVHALVQNSASTHRSMSLPVGRYEHTVRRARPCIDVGS